MKSSLKTKDKKQPKYNRPTLVIPVLLIIIGILMSLFGWLHVPKEEHKIIIEFLKVMGIELIVGSSVVLFNYIIYGREKNECNLSSESYNDIESIVNSNIDKSYCIINNIVCENSKKMLETFNASKELAPLFIYESCDEPNLEFNKMVNVALKSSLEYTYFGDSSTYFVSRLKSMGCQAHKQINVFVPDYSILELFTSHQLEIRKRYCNDDVNSEQAIITARMRILQNIYVLKKLSNKYNVSVYLHKEIPFLRFETAQFPKDKIDMRDFLVLSFLPIDVNQKRFPPSFIYNNPTYYATFNGYISELKDRSVVIKGNSLESYDFINEAKRVDPSLENKTNKYILDELFESYFDNLQEVDVN